MKKKTGEKHYRSIIKAITWRILATLTTGILVWIFTGSLNMALSLASVEVVIKMLVYYFHERTWNAIEWGRH